MTTVSQPFPLVAHTLADADQLQADIAQIIATVNGNLEADVNVLAGSSSALDGDASNPGSSNAVSRSDHTHIVRGLETLSADPVGRLGRMYFNSVTKAVRLCILTSPDTWITMGNLTAADLPLHAARHGSGSSDPLPALAVDQTMLRARTIYAAVPAADVSPSANAWTDVATGLTVPITTVAGPPLVGQMVLLVVNALVQNTNNATNPTVNLRVIDGAGTVLLQTGSRQFGVQGGNNDSDHLIMVKPIALTASPTLKLQVNSNAAGINVRKSQTINGSGPFPVTTLEAIVG